MDKRGTKGESLTHACLFETLRLQVHVLAIDLYWFNFYF
jgi:hypothetical protein